MTPIRRPAPEPQIDALLRYVSGASPLAEANSISAWAAADPDREATIEEIRAAWLLEAAPPAWDREGVWRRLAGEISNPDIARSVRPVVPNRKLLTPMRHYTAAASPLRRYLAAAAVVLVVAAITVSNWDRSPIPVQTATTMRDIVTHTGQRAVLQLADGSHVTLAADSKLRIPSDFDKPDSKGRYHRQVELEGRAYFDVVHDDSKPFVVRTSSAVTSDIGTSFVMTAYPETHATQVVVLGGSVGLWEPSTENASANAPGTRNQSRPLMVLRRGDIATLDTAGTATRLRVTTFAAYTSWMNGVLVFDRTPVRDVIRELDRWYDVDIRVSDHALLGQHVSATMSTENASEAMQHLAVALGADLHETGRVIRLIPRNAGSR
ncbi:MAG: FecR domain-containing protein [Gemmatimonadaceae bacterium]